MGTSKTRLSRRRFLAAVGSAAAVPNVLASANSQKTDVVVLGAGLSGLYAARILAHHGAKPIVLEASGRVGGRLHTLRRNGVNLELGGLSVGEAYAGFHALAHALGVPLIRDEGPRLGSCLSVNGALLSNEQWEHSVANPLPPAERANHPGGLLRQALANFEGAPSVQDWQEARYSALDKPLATALAEQGWSSAAVALMNTNSNYNDLASASTLDALRRYSLAMQGGRSSWHVDGGNDRVPKEMAEQLGGAVRLERRATSVARQANGQWRVVCANGEMIDARHVICTLPTPALTALSITPQLPEAQAHVLRARPYTAITQVHLRPKRAFWKDDGLPPGMWTDSGVGRVFAIADANGEVNAMTLWLNGRAARRADRLGHEAIARWAPMELARIRPASAGQVDVVHVQSWGLREGYGGAYAEMAPGLGQQTAKLSAQPHGTMHFAGEHTEFHISGMEAAIASGQRAAQEVLLTA